MPNLLEVLTSGNDAGGFDIVNIATCQAGSFSGDGSGLTSVPAPSLADVLNTSGDAGTHDMNNLGTVTANTFIGDGSNLTGLPQQGLASVLAISNDAGGRDLTNLENLDVNFSATFASAGGVFGVFNRNSLQINLGAPQTAGAVYTATEQAMLQAVYDALRTFGFIF